MEDKVQYRIWVEYNRNIFNLENLEAIEKLDALVHTFIFKLPVELNGIICHGFATLALREA